MGKRRLTLAALMALAPGSARADPPLSAPPPGCDLFQAQLISEICGRTGYASIGFVDENETLNRDTDIAAPHGVVVERLRATSDVQAETATLAVAPWEGVRVSLSTQQLQDSLASALSLSPPGSVSWRRSDADLAGAQSLGVEARLWDRDTAQGRFVFNFVADLGRYPGGGATLARDLQQAGVASGARWALGEPGFAVDALAHLTLARADNPDVWSVAGDARLLLGFETYGVAVGPAANLQNALWRAAADKSGWLALGAGAEIVAAPFRLTQIPVLRDLAVEASALHSVGQANLVAPGSGTASAMQYQAQARLDFRY